MHCTVYTNKWMEKKCPTQNGSYITMKGSCKIPTLLTFWIIHFVKKKNVLVEPLKWHSFANGMVTFKQMPSIQIHRMCPDSYNMYINSGFFFFLLLSQKLNCSVILHKLPMTWVYVCGCKMNMQNILALACLRQTIKCRAHETSKHIALLRFAHSHVCTIWLILCDIAKYNSAISESIHFKRFSLSICFSWARCLFFSFSLFFWLLLLLVFFFL